MEIKIYIYLVYLFIIFRNFSERTFGKSVVAARYDVQLGVRLAKKKFQSRGLSESIIIHIEHNKRKIVFKVANPKENLDNVGAILHIFLWLIRENWETHNAAHSLANPLWALLISDK